MHIDETTKNQLLANLAKLGGEAFREDDVKWEGRKFIIPEGLSLDQAIRFLMLKKEEDESTTTFSRNFNYRPWDGGYALTKALHKAFGSVLSKAKMSMFGPVPPALITINTGINETEQIPWSPIEIPLLPGLSIEPGEAYSEEHGTIFAINATGPRKYRFHMEGIFSLVEEELLNNSIYRGKAFDGKAMPDFLDLSGVDRDKIVFPEETFRQLEASVFAPIRYPDKLNELGIALKRAVLLHGPFGTGKTSTAYLVAQEAVANGWTFIMARPNRDDLAEVFKTARIYQPSVVFCEDLDSQTDASDQQSISQLLDLFDGFTSKGTEILAVLTTNYPEKIQAGMLRPGRLDALIHLGPPDAAGIEKLVRIYVPGELLATDINWAEVAGAFGGNIKFINDGGELEKKFQHYLPAFVSESCERALRFSLVRNGGEVQQVNTQDLCDAADELRPQWDMMQDAPEHTPADILSVATEKIVSKGVEQVMEKRGF